jgi:hypothetical protein
MRLLYAMLADVAVIQPDGKLYMIGGGVGTLTGPQLPIRHPQLSLVVRVEFTSLEAGRTHTMEVHGLDADGHPFAGSVRADVTPPRGESGEAGVQFVLNMQNLLFERYGRFVFTILVDNQELGSVPLDVNPPRQLPMQT